MSIYGIIFYILAAIILVTTAMAITRRNVIHAIIYLVIGFFGTALIFYLLGAHLLAALEVIIYAGAIMVLFLFVVMMLETQLTEENLQTYLLQWLPALVMGGITLGIAFWLIGWASDNGAPLPLAMASPADFGRFLFARYWLGVEIASYLLFVALAGALYLGRREDSPGD